MKEIEVFGIKIKDTTIDKALSLIQQKVEERKDNCRIYFVNTNTLNFVFKDGSFVEVLNSADYVFGDGIGVRIACKILARENLKDNVNGTDLTPMLLNSSLPVKPRCFLLGSTPQDIKSAADFFREKFPNWTLSGYHQGYIVNDDKLSLEVVEKINSAKTDLLLVGMGNPLQEKWLFKYKDDLNVPVSMAIGGLFTYWAGKLDRAPLWMRKNNLEWLHILRRQPKKWKRYMFGNIHFLYKIMIERFKSKPVNY